MDVDVGEGGTCSGGGLIEMPEGSAFDIDVGGYWIDEGMPLLSTDGDVVPWAQRLSEFELGAGGEAGGEHRAPFCPCTGTWCFLEGPVECRFSLYWKILVKVFGCNMEAVGGGHIGEIEDSAVETNCVDSGQGYTMFVALSSIFRDDGGHDCCVMLSLGGEVEGVHVEGGADVGHIVPGVADPCVDCQIRSI